MEEQTQKNNPEEVQSGSISNDQKIDVIKELIFGNNMREYQKEFTDIYDQIERTKKDLTELIHSTKDALYDDLEDLRKEMNNRIDEVQMNLNSEIDRLEDKKTDREFLGNLLEDMAQKIKE
jgi:ElaB/YqjD/DUF883 family membrane-anchored ribosome-binding protein